MERYNHQHLISKAPFGFACHKIIVDDSGKPVDYEFVEVNPAFEKITGLKSSVILHKRASNIMQEESLGDQYERIRDYGEIALNGGRKEFEQYSLPLQRWYQVQVYSPERFYFISTYNDITDHKQLEFDLKKSKLLLRSSIESYKDIMLFSVDKNYRYLLFNKTHSDGMKNAYGKDIKVGVNSLECITSEDDRNALKENYDHAMTGKSHREVRIFGDVNQEYYEVFYNPIVSNNEIIGVTCLSRNISDRKKAEAELKESKAKYQAIFESTGTATLIIDSDNTILMANNECLSVTGYTAEEIIGQKWARYVAPASIQEMIRNQKIRRRKQGLAPKKYEVKLINKKGEIRDALLDISLIQKSKRFVVSIIDITERKQAEEAIRVSEENFRSIFENASIPMALIEPDKTVSMVNEEYCRISGYSQEEVIGMGWQDIMPHHDLERFIEHNCNRKDDTNDKPYKYELTFHHKDGSLKHVLTSITILNNNKIVAFFIDITERKNFEMELVRAKEMAEESERFLKERNKELNGIYTFSQSIEYADSCEDVYNELVKKIIPESMRFPEKVYVSLHIDNKKCCNHKNFDPETYNQCFSAPVKIFGQQEGQLTVCYRDDSPFIDIYEQRLIEDYAERISKFAERKRSEAELQQKNEQLTKADTEKNKYFSIIAHDLRSPFTSLLGFTRILDEDFSSMTQDEVKRIIRLTGNTAANLYGLLENLLEWSKLQRGITIVNAASFKIKPYIAACMDLVRESANKKRIEIICDLPDDLMVVADEKMLNSILCNLLTNAVKFTQKGGRVTVSAKPIPENLVEISVVDTGIGMSKEMMNNLFRTDIDTSRKGTEGESSTGLGLIICKEFIEKQCGKLWIKSEEGKGTAFHFTLLNKSKPKPDVNGRDTFPYPKEQKHIRNLKILIAEDDEPSRIIFSFSMKKYGNQVLEVRTGNDAVETCRDNPDIDLVLMDIKMPDMDGLEATKQIREFNKNVVIIAQTAYSTLGNKAMAKEAGCDDFFLKPVDVGIIKGLMEKHFGN